MTRAKTTWLAGLVCGVTLGGSAFAQSPEQPKNPDEQTPANQNDTSNQAGPVEDGRGITSTGNVIDGTGADRTNPADSTAPTHEGVDTTIYTAPSPSTTTTTIQPPHEPVYVDTPTTVVHTTTVDTDTRAGFAISAGGGASGFTNDALRGATNAGGDWDVRLTFGTRSPLAVEASYIGSAQAINSLGVDSDAMLVSNGAQAALRLNGTIDLPVQPFIFGGVAWRRYDLTNTRVNTADLPGTDNVLEIPVGVGVAGRFNGLILDARGEFRPTFDNDLMREINTDVFGSNEGFAAMHRWGVNASVGYEF
jgi:hypothetical protein